MGVDDQAAGVGEAEQRVPGAAKLLPKLLKKGFIQREEFQIEKDPLRMASERLLVETRMSFKEIAAAMGIRYGSVLGLTKPLYRRRGVHSREQLRDWSVAKLRGPQRSSNN